MNSIPKRGPRVMHGFGKYFEGGFTKSGYVPKDDIQAEIERRRKPIKFTDAEFVELRNKVSNIEKVIAAFEGQCQQRPPDDPQRLWVERMLQTFKDALAAASRIPK